MDKDPYTGGSISVLELAYNEAIEKGENIFKIQSSFSMDLMRNLIFVHFN